MWMKKLLAILLAFSCFLPSLTPALAAGDVESKRAEYQESQRKVEQARQRKEQAGAREAEARASMNEVMGQLAGLQREINALQKRSDKLQGEIDENKAVLAEKQKKLDANMKIYKKRLREVYEHGQINYLDVLLGAKDFGDFASRMYLLQKIIAADVKLVQAVKQEMAEVEKHQALLDDQMKEIKAAREKLDLRKADIEKVRAQRAALLYKAEEERYQREQDYDRLNAISANIKAMLQSMEGNYPMPQAGNGRFIWPCQGPITSPYGWRIHPVFHTRKYHSGVDIGVDTGTPIHAAANGVIIYSGWMGGYGYAIMIDHGGGLVTIYGHNSSLAVSEGQRVSQGQVVAYAGSTGYSTGPHCHFEVRLHGEVVSPMPYLP